MNFDGLGRWAGLEDVLMAFEPMAVLMAFAAAILDSGVRIGNRCKLFPGFWPWACSDSGFEGVNLGITAGFCPFMPSFVQ